MNVISSVCRPKVPTDLVVRERGEWTILVAPGNPGWAVSNRSGKEIVQLFDGTRTPSDVANLISLRNGLSVEASKKHVDTCLAQAQQSNLVENWPIQPPPTPPVSLSSLGLQVTNACNLHCTHCYTEGSHSVKKELTTQEIFRIIDEVSELPHVGIRIGGGEPTLRPDFGDIIRYAPHGRLTVLTNATQLDAQKLTDLERSGVGVQVSLDGPDLASHECVRGPSTFHATVHSIKSLVERLSGERVTVSMCPMKHNFHLLRPFVDFVLGLGVKHLHFPNLVRLGRAAEAWEELRLTENEMSSFYEDLYALARGGGVVGDALLEGLNVLIGRLFNYPTPMGTTCPVGESLNIGPDGSIYPCTALSDPRFLLGNVKDTRLSDVPKLSECETLREMSRRRVNEITECRSCDWRHYCGAGCMGLALVNDGSFFFHDPLCEFRKRLYPEIILDYADGTLAHSAVLNMQRASRLIKNLPAPR